MEIDGIEKDLECKWKQKESWGNNTYNKQIRFQSKYFNEMQKVTT